MLFVLYKHLNMYGVNKYGISSRDIDKYKNIGTFTEEQRAKEQTSSIVKSLRSNAVFCV
jgi:hypothetical protein